MADILIFNLALNSELLTRLYRVLLGIIIIFHTLFLWKSGIRFNKNTNYFFSPPFPFIRPMPFRLHNLALYLLPTAAAMAIFGSNSTAAAGLFASSLILTYLSLFCYSAWHHDLFLSALIFFLSGLYFAFPGIPAAGMFATLIIFQISAVYFFSGLAKLNRGTLQSDLLVESAISPYRESIAKRKWAALPFKWSVVITELALGIVFWIPLAAVHKAAILFGSVFHTCVIFMTGRGRTFHAMMPAAYIMVILKNLDSYGNEIIWILLLILVPVLSTAAFFPDGTRY